MMIDQRCAQSHQHSIKSRIRCNRSQLIAIFLTTCSCQHSWICKESSLTRNLSWRKWRCWKGTVLTHYIFTSSRGNFSRSGRSCASWLSAYHHCGGRTEWSRTTRQNAWPQQLYLNMMLSCTLRDARNEHDCGTCFWTMNENVCTGPCSLRRHGIFN